MNRQGQFLISLDFELLWGVRDKKTPNEYGENILGVWEAIPKMLESFDEYGVKATWATVGFLFAASKKELLSYCPATKPQYVDPNLSPYNGHFDFLDEMTDKYHFASELIKLIQDYSGQEIATHTFSHYYCLEPGQTREDFRHDTLAAIKIAEKNNVEITSLIFPRNQFNEEYLEVINDLNITAYRGNERIWFHNAANGKENSLLKRAFRLLDTYVNISGHNSYDIEKIQCKLPYDIPSSRFLRPYSPKLKALESLRLKRILNSMTYAARKGEVYHLWWHPHNFGVNQEENFNFLGKILTHYASLKRKYDFKSVSMKELSLQMKQVNAHG